MKAGRRAAVGAGALVVVAAAAWWWTRGRDRAEDEKTGAIEATLLGFGAAAAVTATSHDGHARRAVLEEERYYRIRDVAPGDYEVTAREGDAVDSVRIRVQPGRTTIAQLVPDGVTAVTGRVVDATTGKPIPGTYCSGRLAMRGKSGGTDADAVGRIAMVVPDGEVDITCTGPGDGYAPGHVTVQIEPGTTKEIVVELAPL